MENKSRFAAALLFALAMLLTVIAPVASSTLFDVDDSYTKSLLHFDGADASTTFTDDSGKTWTASGNAQLDTAQQKFGSASLLLDGTGDYITSADHNDFTLTTSDFTIDFWVRFNALPAASATATIYSQQADGNNYFYVGLFNNAGTYRWEMWNRDASTFTIGITKNTTVTTGTWYHVAFVRSGSTFYFFQDGTLLVGTSTDTDSILDKAGSASIGARGGGATFNGWIDEFRFSNGVARWTSNFTPPSAQYAPTPTPTNTNTATFTATDTPTATNTATFTPTFTPTITDTPTDTATFTPTNTGTVTYTATFTETSTPTETLTPTITFTPTNTLTPTATYTPVTPIFEIDPTVTYGDYMQVIVLLGLCGVVIVAAFAIFIIIVVGKRK